MRLRFFIAVSVAVMGCCANASAESKSTASLADVLRDYFRPAQSDTTGAKALPPASASAVRVQLPGIISVPDDQVTYLDLCPSIYRAGEIHASEGSFCETFANHNKRYLRVQDRAYVTGIRVNPTSGRILFLLASCDACEAGQPVVLYHSLLVFDFPRGYLDKTPGDEIVWTIERTLTAEAPPPPPAQGAKQPKESEKPAREAAKKESLPAAPPVAPPDVAKMRDPVATTPRMPAHPASSDPAGKEPAKAASPGSDSAKPEPPAITPAALPSAAAPHSYPPAVLKKGQTPDEVVAILGKPQQSVELGSRLIYVYRNLKIVFLSGRLSDIE